MTADIKTWETIQTFVLAEILTRKDSDIRLRENRSSQTDIDRKKKEKENEHKSLIVTAFSNQTNKNELFQNQKKKVSNMASEITLLFLNI